MFRKCLKHYFSCCVHIWAQTSDCEHKFQSTLELLEILILLFPSHLSRNTRLSTSINFYVIYTLPPTFNFSVTNNLTGKYNCLGIGLKTRTNVWILIRCLLFLRKPVKEAFSVSRVTVVSHAFTLSNCLDYLTLLLQHLVHLINSVFDTNNRTVLE